MHYTQFKQRQKKVFGVKITGAIYIADEKSIRHVFVYVYIVYTEIGDASYCLFFSTYPRMKLKASKTTTTTKIASSLFAFFSAFHSTNNEKHFCSLVVYNNKINAVCGIWWRISILRCYCADFYV